ncbi:MAG: hypothetical protein IJ733_17660 [Lachnospiraceae bacterium]|nr:hypothetical protein [Lachnospiraceae bacterium]
MENIPVGVQYFADGVHANLMDYSADHPEVRFILYSGSGIENAVIWMISDTIEDEAINALIHKAKTKKGFYQMINKESLSNEKMWWLITL